MHRPASRLPASQVALLIILLVLGATACRSTDSTATTPPAGPGDAAMTDDGMDGMDAMDGMDGMAMNMGDPEAVPAGDVPGADLVEGTFELLETRPQGYDGVTGTAVLARHDAGTTVTLRLEGLQPGTAYISHVHAGTCAEGGGDHFQFDSNGSDVPPNEIHLAFNGSPEGAGFMTAENDRTVDERAVSVVVHPVELIDNKIACAEFRR